MNRLFRLFAALMLVFTLAVTLTANVFAQHQSRIPRETVMPTASPFLEVEAFQTNKTNETLDKAAFYVGKTGITSGYHKSVSITAPNANHVGTSKLSTISAAKAPATSVAVEYARNGTIEFARGVLGRLASKVEQNVSLQFTDKLRKTNTSTNISNQYPIANEALSLLEKTNMLEKLAKPSEELRLIAMERDQLAYQHLRFEQTYNGVRFHARDIYIHTNAEGEVYCVNGHYEPTPEHLDVTPRLTSTQALNAVKTALQNAGEWEALPESAKETFSATSGTEPELLLYPVNGRAYLAYSVIQERGTNRPTKYFVDAKTGFVLDRIGAAPVDGASAWGASLQAKANSSNTTLTTPESNEPKNVKKPNSAALLMREAPMYAKMGNPSAAQPSIQDAKPLDGGILSIGAFIDVTGPDLRGITRKVRAWKRTSDGNIFPVSDDVNYRETPDDHLPRRPNGGHVVLNANNTNVEDVGTLTINFITEGQTFTPDVISALWNTDSCRRYFAVKFKRTSWDGNGTRMTTLLNIGGKDRDAAWWSSGLGSQGYGPGAKTALSTVGDLWTIGHEVGHAVNGATARLEYNNVQQGGMEEHFANVWGWMCDRETFWMAQFAFGTDPTNGGRHMGNRDSIIGAVSNSTWPTRMSEFLTAATSPHANSGIPNRAAYSCILSLGRDTTEQLWYRALTNYTTQNSGFADLRRGVTQAAQDLYANNTNVLNAVNAAFDDAGILLTTPASRTVVKGGDVDVNVGNIQTVRSVVAFTTPSGRIGYYDTQVDSVRYFTSNVAIVRTVGGRSQLSTPRDGKRLYFVNQRGRLSFIELLTGRVSEFPNLFIRQAGDIASAAIAPDERTVALVSSYANDADVYFATIGTVTVTAPNNASAVRQVPLKRLASAADANGTKRSEGTQISGLRYPDAIGWSPDLVNNPSIVLDALSSFKLDGDTLSYWSLFYVDLTDNKPAVYNLYPPQPDVNLGYPTYSGKSGSTVGFAEYFQDGSHDIYVANFDKTHDTGFLGIPAYKINNKPLADADQPTFAPDDKQLCFTSTSLGNVLFFYTFTTATAKASLRGVLIDSGAVRPYWASLDISTGINEQQSPTGRFLLESAPNPTNGITNVSFTLVKPQNVTLKLYSMLGEEVATLRTGLHQAGEHGMSFDANRYPSGVYYYRLFTDDGVETRPLHIVR